LSSYFSNLHLLCSSTRVDLLSKTEKGRKLTQILSENTKKWFLKCITLKYIIKTNALVFEPGEVPRDVIDTLQRARSRHRVLPLGSNISRAHDDNTHHIISSSELEPDDLIHLTWFSITHKHTMNLISKPPSQPGDKQRLLTLMLNVWEEIHN